MKKLIFPVVLTSVVLMVGPQDTPTKTLIAPFFIQWSPRETGVVFLEAIGRPVSVTATQYTAMGEVPSGGHGESQAREDSLGYVSYHPPYHPTHIRNGWVRLVYPANRDVVAVSDVVYHGDRDGESFAETEMIVEAVEPAVAFRFLASRTDDTETGIAIINPTEVPQDVTVFFHPTDSDRSWPTLEQTWTIEPRHRLSRFLSELVPLEEVISLEDYRYSNVYGMARVVGEAELAVGALDFGHKTGRFAGVPVVAEVPEPQGAGGR